jgi:crossover junction endodeoxyribonuclease RuvC
MIVLGVDPGTQRTGYGLIELTGNHLKHVAHGVIKTSPKALMPERLATIYHELRQVIIDYRPEEVGVESIFTAVNAGSALKLGHARGVILLCAELEGVIIAEYSPTQVKSAVVGYGRAAKDQVIDMVKRLLVMDKKAPEDAADALAVAICHGRSRKTAQMIANAKIKRTKK